MSTSPRWEKTYIRIGQPYPANDREEWYSEKVVWVSGYRNWIETAKDEE